jgi:hypothetical protein
MDNKHNEIDFHKFVDVEILMKINLQKAMYLSYNLLLAGK